jgi:hypothetical protein
MARPRIARKVGSPDAYEKWEARDAPRLAVPPGKYVCNVCSVPPHGARREGQKGYHVPFIHVHTQPPPPRRGAPPQPDGGGYSA